MTMLQIFLKICYSITKKCIWRFDMKKKISILASTIIMSLSLPLLSYASQSARWVGSGDRWQVSDNQGGFIKDCWFQDDVTGHWYMLGAEDGSVMYSGLVTDKSTGKSYLLNVNHDGTYGRMLTVNGLYNINGVDVYMTFNQEHDGTFGAILSGLQEARGAGVNERQLDRIPTDNGGSQQSQNNTANTPQTTTNTNGGLSEYEKQFDVNGDGILNERELANKSFLENTDLDIGQDYGRDWQ